MTEFLDYMEEQRKRLIGQLRIVKDYAAWLRKGEIIQIMDINIGQMYVKSLNSNDSGWIWNETVIVCSDEIEGGV